MNVGHALMVVVGVLQVGASIAYLFSGDVPRAIMFAAVGCANFASTQIG